MDTELIADRAKEAASSSRMFDINGRRIYPRDVVVMPMAFDRGVRIGVVEKMTPAGFKILGDTRVFRSSEVMVLTDDVDVIRGLIAEHQKKFDDSKKAGKPKQQRWTVRYLSFVKTDKKTGDKWLGSHIYSYSNYYDANKIESVMTAFMEKDKYTYRFLCKNADGIYFSDDIHEAYKSKDEVFCECRYVPREEISKRQYDFNAMKNRITSGYAKDMNGSIDEDFVFETDYVRGGKSRLVYPRKIEVKLHGSIAFGFFEQDYHNAGMPVNGIILNVLNVNADSKTRIELEEKIVSIMKKELTR